MTEMSQRKKTDPNAALRKNKRNGNSLALTLIANFSCVRSFVQVSVGPIGVHRNAT